MFKKMQILIIWHIKLRAAEMITIVCLVSANMLIFKLGQVQSVSSLSLVSAKNSSAEFLQNIIYSQCKTNV